MCSLYGTRRSRLSSSVSKCYLGRIVRQVERLVGVNVLWLFPVKFLNIPLYGFSFAKVVSTLCGKQIANLDKNTFIFTRIKDFNFCDSRDNSCERHPKLASANLLVCG